jgi:uncharacterized protein (TIGR03382 family)
MARSIGEVGYWSGLVAFAAVVAYDIVQILQIAGVLQSPLDEILIYGTSLCIVVPFLLEMLAFHHLTPREKQFWTHASVVFATIYAVFVVANYVVQLATVVPAKVRGASEAIRILEQTPHSLVTPLISTVYFYPTYSTRLLFLGFPWAITAPLFMLMLAIMMRRRRGTLVGVGEHV